MGEVVNLVARRRINGTVSKPSQKESVQESHVSSIKQDIDYVLNVSEKEPAYSDLDSDALRKAILADLEEIVAPDELIVWVGRKLY